MFPNVRLMIAAVAASVLALCCGFAMFAAFRVNHEPLSRLATGNAPLQLAADSTAPSVVALAAGPPFGARFELIQTQTSPAAAAASPVAATGPAMAAAAPAQAAAAAQAPATVPEAKQDDAIVAPPEPPVAVAVAATTDTAAIDPAPEQAAPAEQAASVEQPAPGAQAASAEQSAPAEQAAAAEQPTQTAAMETTTAAETPTATTTAAAPPSEVRQKIVRRQRLAARARRVRAAHPRAIAQQFTSPNAAAPRPNFQAARAVAPASGVGGPFVPPANH